MPSKTVNAGSLFYAVAFDKRGAASDGAGGTTAAFEEQFTTMAALTHLRGGEGVQAARLEGRHVQIVRVRATARTRAVTTDWRVRDTRTGDAFNIRDVEPSLDRQWIDFMCEKGVAA